MNDENENRVKTTITNQCTWVRNDMATFQWIVNKDIPCTIKNIVFTANIHMHYL